MRIRTYIDDVVLRKYIKQSHYYFIVDFLWFDNVLLETKHRNVSHHEYLLVALHIINTPYNRLYAPNIFKPRLVIVEPIGVDYDNDIPVVIANAYIINVYIYAVLAHIIIGKLITVC